MTYPVPENGLFAVFYPRERDFYVVSRRPFAIFQLKDYGYTSGLACNVQILTTDRGKAHLCQILVSTTSAQDLLNKLPEKCRLLSAANNVLLIANISPANRT